MNPKQKDVEFSTINEAFRSSSISTEVGALFSSIVLFSNHSHRSSSRCSASGKQASFHQPLLRAQLHRKGRLNRRNPSHWNVRSSRSLPRRRTLL